MRRSAVIGTAGALAFASCLPATAVRSCSFNNQETGFDAYLPLGESKLGISCTSWIGSSGICYAGDLSYSDRAVEVRGSAKHVNGFIGIPIPFSGKRLEAEADAKSRSHPLEVKVLTRRFGLPDSASIDTYLATDGYAAFRKAAERDMRQDSHGNSYLPIRMNPDPGIPPQKAQWAFLHAIYPGELFAPGDPLPAIHKEAQHLLEITGEDPVLKLLVHPRALVATVYHQQLNRLREVSRGDSRHGSCGHGIGETRHYWLKYGQDAVVAADLKDREMLAPNHDQHIVEAGRSNRLDGSLNERLTC